MANFNMNHDKDGFNIKIPFNKKHMKTAGYAIGGYYLATFVAAGIVGVWIWNSFNARDEAFNKSIAEFERTWEEDSKAFNEDFMKPNDAQKSKKARERCYSEMDRRVEWTTGGLYHNCKINPDTGKPFSQNEMIAKWYVDPKDEAQPTGDETWVELEAREYQPNFGKTIADGDQIHEFHGRYRISQQICRAEIDRRGLGDSSVLPYDCMINPDTGKTFTKQEMIDKWYVSFEDNPYRTKGTYPIEPNVGKAIGKREEVVLPASLR